VGLARDVRDDDRGGVLGDRGLDLRRACRVRSNCRFRNRGTEYVRGMWYQVDAR
jgi:hypothetical protein